MKNRITLFLVAAALLIASVACGPVIPPPPPTVDFEAPDKTLTAIFSVLVTPDTTLPPVTIADTPTPELIISTDAVITVNAETLAAAITSAAETEAALATDTPVPTDTPTEKPTNTPVPTATSTSTTAPTSTPTPPSRSGPMVYAPFLANPPIIDGSLGDWGGEWTTANNVVFGRDHRENAADLSARFKIGWDWNYLYLAVQVTDETYVQEASGEEIFLGDSLDIQIDNQLAEDYNSEALSSDDYQLGMSGQDLVKDDGEAYLWYPDGSRGPKSKVVIQARPTDDGYRMEIAIPWGVLGMSPSAGMHYGFCFSVSDNDAPGTLEQHSMISNVEDRKLTDPTTWGNLILSK